MMIMYPMTDREKRIKELEKLKLQQAKSRMIDEEGIFRLKFPSRFNFLLGCVTDGAPQSPVYVKYLEIPKITTKRVRV